MKPPAQPLQIPVAPAQRRLSDVVYASARLRTAGSEEHLWGRCRCRLEASPGGLVLTMTALSDEQGRSRGDLMLLPLSSVESLELQPSSLTDGGSSSGGGSVSGAN